MKVSFLNVNLLYNFLFQDGVYFLLLNPYITKPKRIPLSYGNLSCCYNVKERSICTIGILFKSIKLVKSSNIDFSLKNSLPIPFDS